MVNFKMTVNEQNGTMALDYDCEFMICDEEGNEGICFTSRKEILSCINDFNETDNYYSSAGNNDNVFDFLRNNPTVEVFDYADGSFCFPLDLKNYDSISEMLNDVDDCIISMMD